MNDSLRNSSNVRTTSWRGVKTPTGEGFGLALKNPVDQSVIARMVEAAHGETDPG